MSYLKHPLMLQTASWVETRACAGKKTILQAWRDQGEPTGQTFVTPKSALLASTDAVFSNGGSSFGTVKMPWQYPIKSSVGGKPVLEIISHISYLRCRSSEFYLIAMGRDGGMAFGCWFDGNVFDEQLIKEWVSEVVAATKHYLAVPSSKSNLQQTQANL